MKLSGLAVKRPVTTFMFMMIAVILGLVSTTLLPVDLYPEIDVPVSVVTVSYSGAAPEEVENLITIPLEQTLSTVSNLSSVESYSNEGASTVVVLFEYGTDMDIAALEMREKVDLIRGVLPEDASAPMVLKIDPNAFPIMQIGISGGMEFTQLQRIAEEEMLSRLERIDGVASANVFGGVEQEVRVRLDQSKMMGYGLDLSRIQQQLSAENVNLPGGRVLKGDQEMTVRTMGEFTSLADVGNMPIILQTGDIIQLQDIANVSIEYKERTSISRLNGQPNITLSITKQSVANTVRVAERVHQELDNLRRDYPELELTVAFDTSEFINASIRNVVLNAVMGGLLAIIILFLFLRNLRSTIIVGIAIPVSIISTFALMYFGNLTINLISLGGLALGIGMLVDNSIVVLENIYRYRELGENRRESAVKGASEVAMAITASTLTTVAVFMPIVFVQGFTAIIFRQLSFAVAFSLLASLLVALTVVPMMSSKILKVGEVKRRKRRVLTLGWLLDLFEVLIGLFSRFYQKTLRMALNHRIVTVILAFAIFASSLFMVGIVGGEFFPSLDEGTIRVSIETPHGTRLEDTDRQVMRVENILVELPESERILAQIGSGGMMFGMGNPNVSTLSVTLVDQNQRERSTGDVAEEIRQMTQGIAGVKITADEVSSMQMGGGGGSPVVIQIQGDDLKVLETIGRDVQRMVREVPGTTEVSLSVEEGEPEARVVVQRNMASRYGVTAAQINRSLRAALDGVRASSLLVAGDNIDITLSMDQQVSESIENMQQILIPTSFGTSVPLGQMATIEYGASPAQINRINQVRTVVISSQLSGRDLQSVTNEIQRQMSGYPLPPGYSYRLTGQQEEMVEAFGNLGLALLLSVILVYMIMASQFESLLYPFIIMFSIPFAFTGAFIGLFITGRPLSVPALIGMIMLAGIVVNNAIVLVDYINQLRDRGTERNEAVKEAVAVRFRPILMTALTTILALIPLAIGVGEGAETQAPLATVVVGGLIMSTLLTMVFIPVLYTIMDDLKQKVRKWFKREPVQQRADN
ncbi:MAG: efflux RND transporter permease subunit [Bacillota bacterium]|nr:efflux RND transporter permease subunit [Bacillota bacterium]MDW7676899.1 efflux RND transporter permease subunit [Bacillota bacterium]